MARKRATPLITDFDNIPADALVPKDEQPYEIPAHWKWVRLRSICNLLSGRDEPLSACNSEGSGIPYVMGASNLSNAGLTIERWIAHPKVVSAAGDLLVSVKGTVGKMYIQQEPELNLSRQIMAIQPGRLVEVTYLLQHVHEALQGIQQQSVGLIPGISRAVLLTLPIPLPPIDEQKTIVEKLQATNQKIDDVLERLDQFLDQAPQQRAAIIQAGVTGTLTKSWREEHSCTMDTWLNTTVQGIGQVVTGGTPPTKDPSNYGPGIAFVKPTDLNQGRHVVGAEAALSAIGAERSRVLPPNSVAMCCIGATITKAGLIEVESATNQQINAVVPNDDSDPVFIYYLFESTRFKQKVLDNSSATTLPIINKGRFSKLPVSVPPKKEQAEIATKVDAAMASAERAVEVATVVKSQLELTKSVVRMRALRGLV